MALKFQLVLQQANGRAAANVAISVYFMELASGNEVRAMQGNTNSRGALTLQAGGTEQQKLLPHFRVTWRNNQREMPLGTDGFDYREGTVNLGTRIIDPRAVLAEEAREEAREERPGVGGGRPVLPIDEDITLPVERTVDFQRFEELRIAKVALEQDYSRLKEQKLDLDQQLELREQSFSQERQVLQERHQQELLDKQQQLESLQEQFESISLEQGADVTIEQLISRTGSSLNQAREEIEKSSAGFTLGNVTMKLRGLAGQGGTGLSFVGSDKLEQIDAGAFSEMVLEFQRPRGNKPADQSSVRVPDLSGYTSTMAKRLLRQQGLQPESEYEAVIDPPGQASLNGRVVQQEPAAGSTVAVGSRVVIAIGKRINSEP